MVRGVFDVLGKTQPKLIKIFKHPQKQKKLEESVFGMLD
jgi:hypothetical protein